MRCVPACTTHLCAALPSYTLTAPSPCSKDMLDEALLRPGRLEVQIEIGLPDTKGRLQILNIHTSKVRLRSPLPLPPPTD